MKVLFEIAGYISGGLIVGCVLSNSLLIHPTRIKNLELENEKLKSELNNLKFHVKNQ